MLGRVSGEAVDVGDEGGEGRLRGEIAEAGGEFRQPRLAVLITRAVAGFGTVLGLGDAEDFFAFVPLKDERAIDSSDEFGIVGRLQQASDGRGGPAHLYGDDDAEEDSEDGAARVGHGVLVNYALGAVTMLGEQAI